MGSAGIEGTVAVVTGAAGGIGSAVARSLADAGAHLAILDVDAALDALAGDLRAMGTKVLARAVDVSDSTAVDQAVDRVETDLGPIGILVNGAGVLRPEPVVFTGDDDWAETFAVNATGVFVTARAVARRMVPRRSGVIITVASNAASVPRMHLAAYAASKAAAAQFTKCLGLELAGAGIRCNVVSPGSTDTAMLRALSPGADAARLAVDGTPSAFRTGIPLGRVATPGDIADAVVFLASDQARHITMRDLCVDGGAALGV